MKKHLASLLVVTALASGFTAPVYAHEDGKAAQETQAQAAMPLDIRFLDMMADHHEKGIKMMNMAIDKASSSDIRSMSQDMRDTQKKEIEDMKEVHKKVEGKVTKTDDAKLPEMKPMDMKPLENASGAAFDKTYLQMMIDHHKGAVAMADVAIAHAQTSEVKAMAHT